MITLSVQVDPNDTNSIRASLADISAILAQMATQTAVTVAPEPEPQPQPNPASNTPSGLEGMGVRAQKVFTVLAQLIKAKGKATLEDVAAVTGDPITTVRADHRNGSRTLKRHHRVLLAGVWDPASNCCVYTGTPDEIASVLGR
jgi:hypothetical protein